MCTGVEECAPNPSLFRFQDETIFGTQLTSGTQVSKGDATNSKSAGAQEVFNFFVSVLWECGQSLEDKVRLGL